MQLSLNEFFIYLIQTRGFYGRLASSLHRIPKPGMRTMAVGIKDGRCALYYDPEFVAMLDVNTALFVLEHEMLHLVLDHIPRFLELLAAQPTELDKKKAAAVYNIAMDCAINTLDAMRKHAGFEPVQKLLLDRIAAEHPDEPMDPRNGLVLPEKFDLPLEGSFEMYQYMLMRKVEIMEICLRLHGGMTHEMWGQPDEGEGDGEGDGEGGEGGKQGAGEDGDGKPSPGKSGKGGGGQGKGKGKKGDNKAVFEGVGTEGMSSDELLSQANRVREQIKNALRQTIRNMGGLSRGILPGEVEEFLTRYLEDPIIPWWEVFSTRARMSRPSKFQRSCTQPNRTLMALSEEDARIIPMPGRSRDRSWRIFAVVDTSGSMSTESLEIFLGELEGMINVDEGTEVRYIQGDSEVHLDIVLKKGDEIPRSMLGRGGTDFDAYFEHMQQYVKDDEKTPDLVVVYTDGYAPAVKERNRLPPEIPIIWLVTPQHSSAFAEGYGEIIVCDPGHNSRHKGAA
jgi:predicted metal-dependent peptidase